MSESPELTLLGLLHQYSPSGQEAQAVDWLVGRMKALGYDQAGADSAGNAVGVMGSGPRQVILLGHIDTVPGEIPVRMEDGILYGRGAVDAKGPLAAFVEAVARLGRVEGWQFIVIGAVDEERDSSGARYLAPLYRPDFAIIGEPGGWNRLALGYKGAAWAEVAVERRMAHTASGQESACEAAIDVWQTVRAWAEAFNIGRQRAFEQVLLSLREMHSGEDGFTQRARLKIMARLPPDLPPSAWYTRLADLAAGAQVQPLGMAIPAYQCEKNTPLVRAFLAAIRARAGTPGFVYKTGTADLNIVAPQWGCPAVVYGPGDSALDHTPHEHLSLAEFHAAVDVLAHTLRRLAGLKELVDE